ncbi:hypothetical protein ACFSE0_07550 [Ochrobactrum teleogrylli]|uniref:Uncharacterized protein n=1 Tax=Ochrobactrum teleogrylli TaxID=2479765 RepID=A0ABY2Y400_9HYPH|nr:hypothetical protein [[Ochrobactrum] teleogrylli]TNV13243.1 hypothetical protein FIC94_16035 [[Ochrobactrum] teleogrylli]
MTLERFKKEIAARWRNSPAALLCVKILDKVEDIPLEQLNFVTFKTFANMAEHPSIDLEILGAVNILTNSSFALFDAQAVFIDEFEVEYPITLKELNDAKRTGIFIHPDSGMDVPDFADRIFPVFSASSKLHDEIAKQ